jgi:hypothetical protein
MLKTALWALLAAINIYLIYAGIVHIDNGINDGNGWRIFWGFVLMAGGLYQFEKPFKEGLK